MEQKSICCCFDDRAGHDLGIRFWRRSLMGMIVFQVDSKRISNEILQFYSTTITCYCRFQEIIRLFFFCFHFIFFVLLFAEIGILLADKRHTDWKVIYSSKIDHKRKNCPPKDKFQLNGSDNSFLRWNFDDGLDVTIGLLKISICHLLPKKPFLEVWLKICWELEDWIVICSVSEVKEKRKY